MMNRSNKSTKNLSYILYYKVYLFLAFITFIVSYVMTDTGKAEQIDGKNIEAVYKVKFHYEGYEEERKIAYKFFWQEDGKYMPWIKYEHIGVDLFDLNGDGQKEIFAYVNGEGMCPRAGCPFILLKKNQDKKCGFIVLDSGGGTFNSPYVLKTKTKGFHDLVFGEKFDQDLHVWKWNGREYD